MGYANPSRYPKTVARAVENVRLLNEQLFDEVIDEDRYRETLDKICSVLNPEHLPAVANVAYYTPRTSLHHAPLPGELHFTPLATPDFLH